MSSMFKFLNLLKGFNEEEDSTNTQQSVACRPS